MRPPVRTAAWSPTALLRVSMGLHAAGLAIGFAAPQFLSLVAGALIANQAVLVLAGFLPQNRWLGANLSRLPEAAARRGLVALTFDDGPDPVVTPRILDLLDRDGAKASFFCIGNQVAAHPEIVRDIVRRGHSVENHSYSHPYGFACYGTAALRREVEAAQQVISTISGRPATFFRAPMGLRSPLLDLAMTGTGLRYTSWTRRGFDGVNRDPIRILRRLTSGLAAGDVLLLHDGRSPRMSGGEAVVLAVLPALLHHLRSRGLTSVSLPMALDERSV